MLGHPTQSVSVETLDASGGTLAGATCELVNGDGRWRVTTPGSIVVRRSRRDLDVMCRKGDSADGSASVISRTTSAMYGNIVMPGGLIGAIVDHFRGTAYSYPDSLQIVMGRKIQIDPRNNGTPTRSPPQWTPGGARPPVRGGAHAAHQGPAIDFL